MQWRSIKPVHGWPSFFQEVAVVVLGVLIALGAQQLVEAARWRVEVAEFRAALDDELGYNISAYQDRLEQSPCINRRLDQLDSWQRKWKAGERLRLTSPILRPLTLDTRSNVWQSRTADVVAHLGLETRLRYAGLYDTIDTHQAFLQRERDLWNEMLDFEGAGDVQTADLMRLRGLIERAKIAERLVQANWRRLRERAAEAGIGARRVAEGNPWDAGFCKPLQWEPA
jgi:hypothetical protein